MVLLVGVADEQADLQRAHARMHARTHTHPFNSPLSGTTQVSQYQKGKTNLDVTGARDSEWQWNPLGHMQVCTPHQTDNHASTPLLSFLQARCPSCQQRQSTEGMTYSSCRIFVNASRPLRRKQQVDSTELSDTGE